MMTNINTHFKNICDLYCKYKWPYQYQYRDKLRSIINISSTVSIVILPLFDYTIETRIEKGMTFSDVICDLFYSDQKVPNSGSRIREDNDPRNDPWVTIFM